MIRLPLQELRRSPDQRARDRAVEGTTGAAGERDDGGGMRHDPFARKHGEVGFRCFRMAAASQKFNSFFTLSLNFFKLICPKPPPHTRGPGEAIGKFFSPFVFSFCFSLFGVL